MPAKSPITDFNAADLERALHMIVCMGKLYEIDYESTPPRARVQLGAELITDFLPLPEEIGHNFRRWRPCRVGTQALIACPSGDSRQGVIVALYNTTAIPQPETDPAVDLVEFDDGTILRKDGEELRIDSAVPVYIKAELITLDTPLVHCTGDVQVDGTLTADVDCVSAGVSGKGHVHLIIYPTPGAPVTPPMML